MGRAAWIQVPLRQALGRCAGGEGRPLLQDDAQAEALYRRRLPSYRAAGLHVDADGLTAEEVAERIAGLL
jgi:shikimate kinase